MKRLASSLYWDFLVNRYGPPNAQLYYLFASISDLSNDRKHWLEAAQFMEKYLIEDSTYKGNGVDGQ